MKTILEIVEELKSLGGVNAKRFIENNKKIIAVNVGLLAIEIVDLPVNQVKELCNSIGEHGYVHNDYIVKEVNGENGLAGLFHKTDVYFNGHPTPRKEFKKWTPTHAEWVLCWDKNYSEPKLMKVNDNVLHGFFEHCIPYLGQTMEELGF